MLGTFNALTLRLEVSCLGSNRHHLRIQVSTSLWGTAGPECPIFESEKNIFMIFPQSVIEPLNSKQFLNEENKETFLAYTCQSNYDKFCLGVEPV